MMKKILIFCFTVVFCFTSCKTNDDEELIICTTVYVYGLNLSFVDATTMTKIASDIEVVAKDGSYEETLMLNNATGNFIGAGERPGNYIITATSLNHETFTSDTIMLSADECHVIPVNLEFTLQPN